MEIAISLGIVIAFLTIPAYLIVFIGQLIRKTFKKYIAEILKELENEKTEL